MASEREEAARISGVAVDLTNEMAAKVTQLVGVTCGARGDLVRYIVGTAFVAIGAGLMRRFAKGAFPALDPGTEAIEIVRGIYAKEEGT